MNPQDNYQPQTPPPTPAPYPMQQPIYGQAPANQTPPQPTVYPPQNSGQIPPAQPGYGPAPYQQPYANGYGQPPAQPVAPQGLPPAAPPPPSYTPPPRPQRYDKLPLPLRLLDWAKKNWWAPVLGLLLLLIVGQIIYQVAYPANALPPGTMVDGQDVGGMDRQEAIKALNEAYGDIKTDVYFGTSTVAYRTPEARELGISVDNSKRLADVSYPMWLRLIPSSIMWASSLHKIETPLYNYDTTTIDRFVQRQLGADCTIKPQNATIKLDDNQFMPVPSMAGGKCDVLDFKSKVAQTKFKDGKMSVRTDMNEVPAPINDDMAKDLSDTLNTNLAKDASLVAGNHTQEVPARIIKGWLSFKPVIPEVSEDEDAVVAAPKLTYAVEEERVRKYFDSTIASKVEQKPGTTKIATTDYTETSRQEGAPGVMIDMGRAIASINQVVAAESQQIVVATGPVPAIEQYSRTYTPSEAGMSALIEQFAHDNKGRIGIYMQEESGKKPMLGGSVRADEVFPAAGIEGLYVAYAAQLGIEDGSIQPTDRIAGSRSVADCIPEAIAQQDSDCIEALLGKVGMPVVVQRLQALGLRNTAFSGAANTTTAHDAYTFMVKMRSKEFPLKSKGSLETPLREMQLREGMIGQFGSAGGIFVMGGSNDTAYNEMAYISDKGVYQIGIMTEGSDGAKTVAKLTQAIEKLRSERQALKSR